jgi:hypothetical protein
MDSRLGTLTMHTTGTSTVVDPSPMSANSWISLVLCRFVTTVELPDGLRHCTGHGMPA